MSQETILLITDYSIRIVIVVLGTLVIGLIRKYNLEKWTKIAVKGVEMIYRESGMGDQKKQYVIEFIKSKFKVSDQELNILIE